MWWLSGIIRDVSVIKRQKLNLSDYKLDSLLTNNYKDGYFTADIEVENSSISQQKVLLEA
ncbi:hypothetical protein V6615_12950 [Oscillospiraceae bacterium PP1C4]